VPLTPCGNCEFCNEDFNPGFGCPTTLAPVQVAVLNGVNLDVLGDRDPALYGGLTLGELENRIYRWGRELGLQVRCLQTNHEGQYVDWCHEARLWASGIILNPGAWSHYSYAIRDAVELFEVPVIEVHLSDITKREEFRRHSVLEDVVTARVIGKGPEGYREALVNLAEQR
jgi:3-dehydroquinate dehydratase II